MKNRNLIIALVTAGLLAVKKLKFKVKLIQLPGHWVIQLEATSKFSFLI
jgi:hypothetical protein